MSELNMPHPPIKNFWDERDVRLQKRITKNNKETPAGKVELAIIAVAAILRCQLPQSQIHNREKEPLIVNTCTLAVKILVFICSMYK